MKRSRKTSLTFATLLLTLSACSGGGDEGERKRGGSDAKTLPGSAIPGGAVPTLAPTASPATAGVTPTPIPGFAVAAKCSEGKVTVITANQSCPANSTVFAGDDTSAALLTCCTLPASDILLTTTAPVARSGECANNEVIVGLGSTANQLLCQPIDTSKYVLSSSSIDACKFSSKSNGNTCGMSKVLLDAIMAAASSYGNDGCVAGPSSVIHGKSGSSCSKFPTRSLKTIAGADVAFP